jgi:hypothetical protein
MEYALIAVLIAAAIYGIVKRASGDRYSNMTEQEFETEARRGSAMSGVMAEVQKIVDPNHHVEHVQDEAECMEADGSESGDKPAAGPFSQRRKDSR